MKRLWEKGILPAWFDGSMIFVTLGLQTVGE